MRLADFKGAWRRLVARPGYSLLSIVVLGLGLGTLLFVLSLVNGLILRPLPFPASERLVAFGQERADGVGISGMAASDFRLLEPNLGGVEALGLYANSIFPIHNRGSTRVYSGALLSAQVMPILGVEPVLGRGFAAADDQFGAAPVVLLSDRAWRSDFNGDPAVVGSTVRVNGKSATIVGVLPPAFAFPINSDVWMATGAGLGDLKGSVVGRLAEGTSLEAIGVELESVTGRLGSQLSGQRGERKLIVKPLAIAFVNENTRAYVWLMMAASTLVLLLACANVANLQLSQTLHRRRELAMRNALGASRGRLLSEQLAESLLLSLAAAVVAIFVTEMGSRWLLDIFSRNEQPTPYFISLGVDSWMLLYALLAALLTTALAGAVPAVRASRTNVQDALREGEGGSAVRGGFARISSALVVGEIALTVVLLVSAGSFILGLNRMLALDLGTQTDPSAILTASVDVLPGQFADEDGQTQFFRRLVELVSAQPEVLSATIASTIPGAVLGSHESIAASGSARPENGFARAQSGSADEFFAATYGLQLVSGRFFDRRDRADSTAVAVIDHELAETLWPKRDPLGQTLVINPGKPRPRRVQVIGTVAALHLEGPMEPQLPSYLVPLSQWPVQNVRLAVRTRGDAAAFAPRLAELIREHDSETPIHGIRTQRQAMDIERISAVVLTQIFSAVGLIALLLAGSGLYGVLAFSVVQRTREIGIRRAIGASDKAIIGLVGRRLALQVGMGLAVGVGLALPWSALLADPELQTRSFEAAAFATVVVLVLVVALVAALVPAFRAIRVDPLVALRHD